MRRSECSIYDARNRRAATGYQAHAGGHVIACNPPMIGRRWRAGQVTPHRPALLTEIGDGHCSGASRDATTGYVPRFRTLDLPERKSINRQLAPPDRRNHAEYQFGYGWVLSRSA